MFNFACEDSADSLSEMEKSPVLQELFLIFIRLYANALKPGQQSLNYM